MAIDLNTIITNINSLSESVNSNVFITSAREAFKNGIAEYEISDEERAKLMATYEAQVSVGVIGQIMAMVKELPEISARVGLLTQQKLTETEQTARVKYEHENILPSQKAQIDSQKAMLDQQKLTETEQTASIAKDALLKDEQIQKLNYEHINILPSQKESIDSQKQLYDRQRAGFNDNVKLKMYEYQLNSWGLMFSSGMLTTKPSIIDNDSVSTLHTQILNSL